MKHCGDLEGYYMKTMTTFIRISTLCVLMTCISLGCSKPAESNAANVDDWQIAEEIADRCEDLTKDLQADLASGRLDEEGYQRELALVPGQVARERREESMRRLGDLLIDEGRRVKLSLIDLNDEIQAFIQVKGLYSLGSPEGTPEWNVLEKLSMDRLDARIEIRMAEEEINSRPSPADTSANTQIQMPARITELKKRLAAMDAEYELLDDLMRDRCSDASLLQHFLTTRSSLEEMREENQRAIIRIRMRQLTPAKDEELLLEVIGE